MISSHGFAIPFKDRMASMLIYPINLLMTPLGKGFFYAIMYFKYSICNESSTYYWYHRTGWIIPS